jgi:hypothetical protein
MTINRVAKKLHMKPGVRALIIAAPPGYRKLLEPLPEGTVVSSNGKGTYGFVQIFATKLSEIGRCVEAMDRHAAPEALTWIAYPKLTSGMESDLNRDVICKAVEGTGWRPVAIVAIDEVWSALRFRRMG